MLNASITVTVTLTVTQTRIQHSSAPPAVLIGRRSSRGLPWSNVVIILTNEGVSMPRSVNSKQWPKWSDTRVSQSCSLPRIRAGRSSKTVEDIVSDRDLVTDGMDGTRETGFINSEPCIAEFMTDITTSINESFRGPSINSRGALVTYCQPINTLSSLQEPREQTQLGVDLQVLSSRPKQQSQQQQQQPKLPQYPWMKEKKNSRKNNHQQQQQEVELNGVGGM